MEYDKASKKLVPKRVVKLTDAEIQDRKSPFWSQTSKETLQRARR
jgi:hypothetical protein